MIEIVNQKVKKVNNRSFIANSWILTNMKIIYYHFLIYLYGKMGNYVDLTFTNSTWTDDHIQLLWKKKSSEKNKFKQTVKL